MKTEEMTINGEFNVDAIVKDGKVFLNSGCGKDRVKEVKSFL